MSILHEMKTGNYPHKVQPGGVSIRSGTRMTRTRAKTAKACGFNYTPTSPWRERTQGARSSKMLKAAQIKDLKKQAKTVASGDGKSL